MQPQITTVTEISLAPESQFCRREYRKENCICVLEVSALRSRIRSHLGNSDFGQIPTHSTTDTARVVKDVQNDIVSVKRRPTDASEMAKRWFKSQRHRSLPIKHPLAFALGAAASRFRVPQENGARKRRKFMSYLYVKWNSFGLRFCLPTFPTLEHGLS